MAAGSEATSGSMRPQSWASPDWRAVSPTHVLRGLFDAPLTWAVAVLAVAVCALLTTIGGDARWLAALGAAIVRTGTIPVGIPYASASSSGWHNVPVLG